MLIKLKETLKDYEAKVDYFFEFLSQDIEIRIESIKVKIDEHAEIIFKKLKKKQKKFSKKITTKIFKIIANIQENVYSSHFACSLKFIKNDILLLSSQIIGALNGINICDAIDVSDIRTNEFKLIKLKFLPYDLCNCFNEVLAITDYLNNKIYLFNKKFQPIRSIACINNQYFKSPRGICSDDISSVYLCDSKNQRILVINKEFSEITKIIKNLDAIEEPQNICSDGKSLFVLDTQIKKILNLSFNGNFLNAFNLYSDNSCFKFVKNPLCMKLIDNCKLAVNANGEKIFIYNFNGNIENIIESNYEIGAFFYSNTFLFTHQSNGFLICYYKNKNEWPVLFERLINCNGTWSSTDFNKHLVFTFVSERSIFVI